MTLQDELYREYIRQQQAKEYNERKKQANQKYHPVNVANNGMKLYNNLGRYGTNISNFGSKMSQMQNPNLANLGTKIQNLGTKIQGIGTPSAPSLAGTTGAGGSSVANGIAASAPTATSLAPSAITAGTGASVGLGASGLGAGTAGAGLGSSLAGTSLGSSALGSSLLGATGGSTAGMGAAGATSALSGSTAAATSGAAGAGMGAAAGASMAVPVIGWAIAAAAAAKMIKDKIDEAHKKVNAKAMQADAQAMQQSANANQQSLNEADNDIQSNIDTSMQKMLQPTGGYTGNLPSIGANNNELTQQMMQQIYPDMPEGLLSPVDSNLGMNTPAQPQTLVNKLTNRFSGTPTGGASGIVPLQAKDDGNGDIVLDKEATKRLVEQQNGDVKQSLLDRIKQGLGDFKAGYEDNSLNGFAQGDLAQKLSGNSSQPVNDNISNAVADAQSQGFDEQQIANMKQGLNGGNQDIAALIDKYSINKPTTDEEIALARKGEFNNDGVLTGGAATTKKTIINRIGEAAGTGRRLMANPWVQAGIAGLISKADGGDIGDMAEAAYKYGTAKAKSDEYYKMMHPDAKVMPVFNTYGADDYKAKAYNDFNQGRTMISRRDMIKLSNPNMSDSDVEDVLQKAGINGDEMISLKGYDAVQKANYNQGRLKQGQQKIDNLKAYQQGQLSIKQQSVNNSKANADRNYQLKLKTAQDKVSKSNLKEQTKQELNKNLAKYSTIVNDPNRSDDDKARARQGMINAYGKDFLSVERSLYEEL